MRNVISTTKIDNYWSLTINISRLLHITSRLLYLTVFQEPSVVVLLPNLVCRIDPEDVTNPGISFGLQWLCWEISFDVHRIKACADYRVIHSSASDFQQSLAEDAEDAFLLIRRPSQSP